MKFAGPAAKLKISEDDDGILFETIPQLRKIEFSTSRYSFFLRRRQCHHGQQVVGEAHDNRFLTYAFVYFSSERTASSLFVAAEGIGDSRKKLIPWSSAYRLILCVGAGGRVS